MSAPDRIWVDPNNHSQKAWFVAGTVPRLGKQDVEYIRKAALPVERIKAYHHAALQDPTSNGFANLLGNILAVLEGNDE